MKLFLLAAAAVIAVPAVAQTTTDTQTQTDMSTSAPATTDSMSTTDTTTQTQAMPATGAPGASAAEQAGGYQPATPPMSGAATPGANVTFQPSASPAQAFPAPAPLDHYPTCKRGQTDKCMEPGGGRK